MFAGLITLTTLVVCIFYLRRTTRNLYRGNKKLFGFYFHWGHIIKLKSYEFFELTKTGDTTTGMRIYKVDFRVSDHKLYSSDFDSYVSEVIKQSSDRENDITRLAHAFGLEADFKIKIID